MISVCKDCSNRYPACWGSCPKYLEAKEEYLKRKREKAKIRHDEQAINGVQYYAAKVYKAKKTKKEKYG